MKFSMMWLVVNRHDITNMIYDSLLILNVVKGYSSHKIMLLFQI